MDRNYIYYIELILIKNNKTLELKQIFKFLEHVMIENDTPYWI